MKSCAFQAVRRSSTASRDRGYKRDLYARSNIGHYWVVDVELRLLEALELRDGCWMLNGTYSDEPNDPLARLQTVNEHLIREAHQSLQASIEVALQNLQSAIDGGAKNVSRAASEVAIDTRAAEGRSTGADLGRSQ